MAFAAFGPGYATTPRKRVVSTSIPMTQRVFRDFFYFSYNLGMTYQVSDTSVSDPTISIATSSRAGSRCNRTTWHYC